MPVWRGGIQPVAIDGEVLHPCLAAIVQPFRKRPRILPEQFACRTAERLDAGAAFHKQNSIMHQWRDLIATERQGQAPGDTEIMNVRGTNLLKGTECEILIGAPPHQPVAIGGT